MKLFKKLFKKKTVARQGIGIEIIVDDSSEEVLAALENAIERGLNAWGETGEGYAKDVIGEHNRIDTGRMRNSVTYALSGMPPANVVYEDDTGRSFLYSGTAPKGLFEGKNPRSVYIGTNVEYAPYHEMGTSRGIKAIHFLRRAATEHTDEYKQLMKDSLENA